jgi:hypothetical protein
MKKNALYLVLFFAVGIYIVPNGWAWDAEITHRNLSEKAAQYSVLSQSDDSYLKDLGMANGLYEILTLPGQVCDDITKKAECSILDWLIYGAEKEDASRYFSGTEASIRSVNHFHDPISNLGLSDLKDGQSAMLWAQDGDNQSGEVEGDASWAKARDYYREALTGLDETSRTTSFAQMFKILGHQIHLIQDMAVPYHVRNDAHPSDAIQGSDSWYSFLFSDNPLYFETWAKKNNGKIGRMADTPVFPSLGYESSPSGSIALSPVSELWDTDSYDGTNPSAALSQGLAEYTNANFFSNDTLFAAGRYAGNPAHKHFFPYPKQSSTDLSDYIDQNLLPKVIRAKDGKQDTMLYLRKVDHGETNIDEFVAVGYFSNALKDSGSSSANLYRSFFLDEACHEAYCQKLIPRAVGYSASLLNYYFRADFDLVPDEDAGVGYIIENATEEQMDGLFEILYDNTDGERILIWSQELSLGPESSGANTSFNIDFSAPVDAKSPGTYILVFQGSLGNEDNHVAGRVIEFDTETSDVALLAKAADGTEYVLYFRMKGETVEWVEENDLYSLPHLPWQTPTHTSSYPRYAMGKDVAQQLVFRLNTPNADPVMLSTVHNGIVLTTLEEDGNLINFAYGQFDYVSNSLITFTNIDSESVNQFKYVDVVSSPNNYHQIVWGVTTGGGTPLLVHFQFSENGNFASGRSYDSDYSTNLRNVSIDNWGGGNLSDSWESIYLTTTSCPIGPEEPMDLCPFADPQSNATAVYQTSNISSAINTVLRPFFTSFLPSYQDYFYSIDHSFSCDDRSESYNEIFSDGSGYTLSWGRSFRDETCSILNHDQELFNLSFTKDSKGELGGGEYTGYGRRWNGHSTYQYGKEYGSLPVSTIKYTIMDGLGYDYNPKYVVTTATGTVGDGVCENSSSGDPSNEQDQIFDYTIELDPNRVTKLLVNSAGEQSTPETIIVRGAGTATKQYLFNDIDITDQVLDKIGTDTIVSFSFCLPQESQK